MSFGPRGFELGERALWKTLKYGGLICWTNNIPFGTDLYGTNRPNPVFDVSGWAPAGVDVDDWVDFGQSIGMQYLVLTVKHNMGWSLFPFTTNIASHTGKDSYHATISLPQVTNYGVNNAAIVGTADQDIVHRFVARCEFHGIKPVLYYNIGKDINARGGFATIPESSFSADTDISDGYPLYKTMVEAHMQELLTAFPNAWLWLDAVAWYPRDGLHDLYDAIRTYGSVNTLVIHNYEPVAGSLDGGVIRTNPIGTNASYYEGSLDGKERFLFPQDIASFENTRIPSAYEFAFLQYQLKHLYWRGTEIVSPLYDAQYFWWDPAVVGGTPNVLNSAATLNALADIALGYFCPFLLTMSPDQDGVILTAQKNRLTDVANHIFP